MRHISVLGSTGSIGTQTLEVARANGDIRIEALAARGNIALLEEQIREFHPRTVCVYDEAKAAELKIKVADTGTQVYAGQEGLIEVATEAKAKTLVTGIVGMIGIEPTVAAIREGKNIALANKETLVCAGHIIMPLAAREGVKILPGAAHRLGALGQRSISPRQQEEPDPENTADRFRRPVPRLHEKAAREGDLAGRPPASDLEHGA